MNRQKSVSGMNVLGEKKIAEQSRSAGAFISFYPVEDLDSVPAEISIDTFEAYAKYRAERRTPRAQG